MNSKSQSHQDIFVMYLIDNSEQRYFVDVGCNDAFYINNTALLEENGWTGISLDINSYFAGGWKLRRTPFILGDALTTDYSELYSKYNLPKVIDYLTLDIEGDGDRYKALKQVMNAKYEYKVITIEHDSYRGYYNSETVPQRKLLSELGYTLICSDVTNDNAPYEDWWINQKYITKNVDHLKCDRVEHSEIVKRFKK